MLSHLAELSPAVLSPLSPPPRPLPRNKSSRPRWRGRKGVVGIFFRIFFFSFNVFQTSDRVLFTQAPHRSATYRRGIASSADKSGKGVRKSKASIHLHVVLNFKSRTVPRHKPSRLTQAPIFSRYRKHLSLSCTLSCRIFHRPRRSLRVMDLLLPLLYGPGKLKPEKKLR